MNTKLISKFRKWQVTGAIALVIIFSMALSMLPAPAAAQQTPSLDVEVGTWLKDHASGDISPLDRCLNEGEQFYINAAVNVDGAVCNPVLVTIVDISGQVVLAPCEPPMPSQKNLGEIGFGDCGLGDVWWKLYCTGPGPVSITVHAEGDTGSQMIEDFDTVNLMQCEDNPCPIVHVDIIEPEFCPYHVNVSEVFGVKAEIEVTDDDCDRDVTGVVAKIAIVDPDTGEPSDLAELVDGMPDHWNLGDMNVGDMHEVGWTLHCKGEGDVLVVVDADFDGKWVKGDLSESAPDECLIEQDMRACLTIENIVAPSEVCANCSDYSKFTVEADICNYCDHDAQDVYATLSVTQGAGLVKFNPLSATKNLGTITAGNCYPDVSWDIECKGEGDVTFQIHVTGKDADSGDSTEDTKTVDVKQVPFLMTLTTDQCHYSVCQDIEVDATMRNCTGDNLADVNVSISWTPPGGAHRVGGDPESQDVDMCNCNCILEPEWTLHCDEPGPLTINVTAKHPCCEAWTKTITVMQEAKAHLDAGIDTYYQCEPGLCMEPISTFTPGQQFHVVVPVCNTGEAVAEDVHVTLDIDNASVADFASGYSETQDIGDIPGGECRKAIWLLECLGEGDTEILVQNIWGNDENTDENIPEGNICKPCEITVKQIPVDIEWIQPDEDEEFAPCEYFTVKAKVCNYDVDDTLTGVEATLMWREGDNVEFAEGQQAMVPLENLLPNDPEIECAEATWEVHCTDFGDVEFTVLVRVADPGMCIKSTPRLIYQDVPDTCLAVDILSPRNCTHIATSEEFAVTVNVTNTGGETAYNAWVYLDDTPADISVLSPSANVDLGEMAPEETRTVTWTLHCDAPSPVMPGGKPIGDTVIKVSTSAQNIIPCPEACPPGRMADVVIVHQYPAAHLVANILEVIPGTTVQVCDNFTVVFEVENTGWADAWEAGVALSVIPEGTARPVEGMDSGYTKFIGTLPGHGQGEKYTGAWELHCKVACESNIVITPFGFDEYGWHMKQTWVEGPYDPLQDCFVLVVDDHNPQGPHWELRPFSEPGRPIEERFIEADTVTVKQLPGNTDLSVEKSIDPGEYRVGDSTEFHVIVRNNGPVDATGVIVRDLLPSGVNFDHADTHGNGWYDAASGMWVVGNIAYPGFASIDIYVQLNRAGVICNRATIVASDQHDLDIANDSAEACTDVAYLQSGDVTSWECCLEEGYNLISLPLIPADSLLTSVLYDVIYTDNLVMKAAYWEVLDEFGDCLDVPHWAYWYTEWPGPLDSQLQELFDGEGYWLDVLDPEGTTTEGCFEYDGYELSAPFPATPPAYDVCPGWNLIGFKSVVPKKASAYLESLGEENYGSMFGYKHGAYYQVLDDDYLEPCQGYWLAVYEQGIIYP